MTDVHSKERRSYNMSRVRSKDSKPELLVRKFLFSKGFRYLLHNKGLPGKPDITLPKYKTVIFVNGCFWHGHEGCKYFVLPKTRTEWWHKKIQTTIIRDAKAKNALVDAGWHSIVIWECELEPGKMEKTLSFLYKCLTQAVK